MPVPVVPNIHARVLAAATAPGALDMGRWHTCGTTHCRGGHVTHLAGAAGAALETRYGMPAAAMMIYRASSPIRVPPTRYYDTAEEALADMRRCAEEEEAAS